MPPVKSGIWSTGTRNSFTQALRSPQQHKEETYYGPWNRALNEAAMDFEAAASDNRFSFTVFPLRRHLEGMSLTLNRSWPPFDPSVTFEVRSSGTIVIIVEIMAPTEIHFEAPRIDAEQHFAARAARLFDDSAARTVYLISVFGLRCKTYTATWNSQGYELNPKPTVKNIRYISSGPPAAEWNWRLDTEEGAIELRRMFWSVIVENNLPVSKKAKLDASGLRRQICVAADVVGATHSPSEESDDESKPGMRGSRPSRRERQRSTSYSNIHSRIPGHINGTCNNQPLGLAIPNL
ncbi:hypothetical protein C8Q74DRAFT_1225512 [Fomes fomentarius]|nr:hypothetical protein C8Q74DRAFT_1225512 [Fomes fomentarius]